MSNRKSLTNTTILARILIGEEDLMQVVLVGHSTGGACISYALELLPQKISKAVYVCATMISDGQKPFDAFAAEVSFYSIYSTVNNG